MYNPRLLQWIGEAEARQMLVIAQSEAVPLCRPTSSGDGQLWSDWMRRWLGVGDKEVGVPRRPRTQSEGRADLPAPNGHERSMMACIYRPFAGIARDARQDTSISGESAVTGAA
jgi:hypothetical protein